MKHPSEKPRRGGRQVVGLLSHAYPTVLRPRKRDFARKCRRQGAAAAIQAAPGSAAHEVDRTTVVRRSRSDDPSSEKTEIGFKKPPKSHSWKKGQSGNPKGRKKGSRNKKTIIISLMEGRLGRKIPDPKKLTAQEALLWKAIQKGPRRRRQGDGFRL